MTRWTRFRRLFGPEPKADVDDELSFHLEMRIRELVVRGESPERARKLALLRFGDYENSRRQCVEIGRRRKRRMARMEHITELRQDVGYALRMLRRTPGFTAVALVTLALGIGANAAIFSVVHGVLLESLPYRDADRLYRVRMLYPDGTSYTALSAPDFVSVRDGNRVFEQVEAYTTGIFTLLGAGEPREIRGANVSHGLFGMLGLPVVVGRGFVPEEHRSGQGSVTVLDYGFWQREFGGDRAVLDRTVTVGGDPFTIVGILGPGVRLPAEADMYAPLEYSERFSASTAEGRRAEYLAVIGRGRPGMGGDQIDGELRRLGTQLQVAFPQTNGTLTFNAIRLRDLIIGDVRTPLLVLLGAVGFVLLVACANVANLLLARASARQGELAVRAALGAGRGRLLRQLLTESVVLSLAGGALGLGLAYWGTRALVAAQPADIPRLDSVAVDGTVVLFTLGIALLTSVAFGMLPAVQATGDRLERALRAGGRSADAGAGTRRVRASLVVAETALAVVLLIGAGLLLRSFVELTRVAPGFQPQQAMAFRITLQGDEYANGQQIRNRVAEFESRLRALPGVTAVGATTVLPLSGLGSILNFEVEGGPPPPPDVNAEIAAASVTPDYFRAVGVPIRSGRAFTGRDDSEAPPVAVINEAGVRRWFAGVEPLGRRVEMDTVREIVGVVPDVLQRHPGEPAVPQLFVPYAQRTTRSMRIVVRSVNDPLALAASIRAELRALDRNLGIAEFQPLEQLVTTSMARPRFYTSLLALFAAVALALAAIGIFGVMSYTVAQRGKEISIRMALGARAGDVLRMVVGQALVLSGAGVVIGVIAALALGRVIQNQLFGVALLDPITLAAVTAVLIASAALASLLPARRAARLDPAGALRES